MLQRFLESADAAQVLELMREAELSALQITEEVQWADTSTWAVVLLVPPARLVFRRVQAAGHDDLTPSDVPSGLVDEMLKQLRRETLWRRVRQQLEARFS